MIFTLWTPKNRYGCPQCKNHSFELLSLSFSPVSNRYNHHLVPRARNQNTTKQRRRALNSRRARKKSGGRWAAAGRRRPPGRRRPGRRRPAAAERPAGPAAVGRLAGPPRARTSRPPNNTHKPQSKRRTHSVHDPKKEPLSFRKSSLSYVYLSAAAILCDHFSSLSSDFRSFAFLAGFALFPKSRKVTKIDDTEKLQNF